MSLQACADLLERGDPDRFAAILAAAPSARGALLAIHAANLEIARAPWASSEPMLAEMRLQWWQDALAALPENPGGHPVMVPLAGVLGGAGLSADLLIRAAQARRWDIYHDPFSDAQALDAYLEATSAGVMWLAAAVLGAGLQAEPVVRAVGWAAGLAAYLRAVPELEARGRVPLLDGRPQAVADLAARGLAKLAQARAGRHLVDRAQAPALLTGWQAAGLLRLTVADPLRVAEGRLQQSEFARRGGLLWQAVTGRW